MSSDSRVRKVFGRKGDKRCRNITAPRYCKMTTAFLLPWEMSQIGTPLGQFGSLVTLMVKFLLVALTVVVIETVQSRLRFYRYQEPLTAVFLFAVLAIVSSQFPLCQHQ
jgi:formate hydrogenlyase subunit 4